MTTWSAPVWRPPARGDQVSGRRVHGPVHLGQPGDRSRHLHSAGDRGAQPIQPRPPLSVRIGLNSGDVTQSQGMPTAPQFMPRRGSPTRPRAARSSSHRSSTISPGLLGDAQDRRPRSLLAQGLSRRDGGSSKSCGGTRNSRSRVTRETRAASAAAFDLDAPRASAPVVGRSRELGIIAEQLATAPAQVCGRLCSKAKPASARPACSMPPRISPPGWRLRIGCSTSAPTRS